MHPAVACLAGAGSLLVIVSVFVPVTFINHDDGDGYKYTPFESDPYFLLMVSIFCYFSLVYLTRAIRKGEEDATLLAEFAFLASGIVMIGRLADLWQGVIRMRSNDGGRLDAGFSVGFWLIGMGGLLFLAAGIAGVLLAARRARFFAVIAWPSPLSARRRIALGALSGLGSALTIASAFPLFTTSPQYSGLESASILTRYVGILLTSLALAVLSCVFLALAAGRATWLRRRMLAAFAVLPLSFGAFAEVTGLEQWIIVRYWRSADSALSGSRTGPGFWLFVGAGLAFLLAGAFAARFIRDIDGRRFPPLQQRLHRIISREIVRDQGLMMLLGTMRAEERIGAFLLELSRRFMRRGFSSSQFILRMTREEIGNYLGLKLETVSRTLSRLQEQGVISVEQRKMQIISHDRLRVLSGVPESGLATDMSPENARRVALMRIHQPWSESQSSQ